MRAAILIALCLSFSFISAQEITLTVIGSAGEHATTSGAQLSWTVGEVAVTTLTHGNQTITQGFHQTTLLVTALESTTNQGLNISVFPNPTSEKVHVQVPSLTADQQMVARLFDLSGSLLVTKTITGAGHSTIDVSPFAQATYLLEVTFPDGSRRHSYRIVRAGI